MTFSSLVILTFKRVYKVMLSIYKKKAYWKKGDWFSFSCRLCPDYMNPSISETYISANGTNKTRSASKEVWGVVKCCKSAMEAYEDLVPSLPLGKEIPGATKRLLDSEAVKIPKLSGMRSLSSGFLRKWKQPDRTEPVPVQQRGSHLNLT